MNNVPFLCTKLFQKRGQYSRGDIIQGRTLIKEIRYLRQKYYLFISQLTCLYFLKTLAGEAIERNYFDKNQQVVQEEEGEEEGSTEVKATKVAEVWPQRQPHTVC